MARKRTRDAPAPETPAFPRDPGMIRVRGARVHNLRDLDVDLPRDRLVVLTGVSGSGKSSLAFDTLHAEGQRRYIEGLSTYARQFLDQMEPPDVDAIDGLPPTVALDQKTGAGGPRSTVATVTEIHDYLRVLYARAGVPHCPGCDAPIARQSPERIVDGLMALPEGAKVILLAPMVRGRKGQHLDVFEAIRKARLIRARVDGEAVDVGEEPPKLAKGKAHSIEAVVDRLVIREGMRPRLAEGVDLALELADGVVIASVQQPDGSWADRAMSTRYACPSCGLGIEEIEPRTFSFNSPHGACPRCEGLGRLVAFEPDLLVPDRAKSLAEGAVPALGLVPPSLRQSLAADERTPLELWPEGAFDRFLRLLHASLEEAYEKGSEARRQALDAYREAIECDACGGTRLRPEARAVRIAGRAIPDLLAMPVAPAIDWLDALGFEPPLDEVGPPLIAEVARRLRFLDRVGVGYLTLDRAAETLSGGELQRVRLAAQIGSGLVGVAYVLDEPTAGLHPRDTDRLLASLADLRDRGNSVFVVEHDETTIRAADWVVDLGPGAGPHGGRLAAQGPPSALVECEPGASATLRCLARPAGGRRRASLRAATGWIGIEGATEHNLKGIDARLPLGGLTCVTGVSGSGKSTLVLEVLARAAARHCHGHGKRPGAHGSITGLEAIERAIVVDQSPIGRSPRSTPATFTGIFDEIRRLFATTREARTRGYSASRFSFNVKGGRCETCVGQGVRKVAMTFLPDLFVTCEACRGLRYNAATLEARYKGKSIGEVLGLRVEEARELFEAVPRLRRGLDALHEAGLGYVTLGQSSTTLSGGEAQRVKLAAELGRAKAGEAASRTLTILDEPTAGLHFADVERLLGVLGGLADLGQTLVVIEHNLDVMAAADWIIDLGPEGGEEGGRVVAMGRPEEVARVVEGHTGRYLAGVIG